MKMMFWKNRFKFEFVQKLWQCNLL